MAQILAISSQVARGHVGLAAIVPALQRLGHEVVALPTILLSNHPGHARAAGERVSPDLLSRLLRTLDENGWLAEIDAVVTGYLPSVEHVRFACSAVQAVRKHKESARVLVDPVLGDEPKGLYIDAAAARCMRDELLPLAHVITPNKFELGWLANTPVTSSDQVREAAAQLTPACALVSSAGEAGGQLENILVDREGGATLACSVARREKAPNGTGDLLAGLFLGHELRLGSEHIDKAFARAVAGVEAVLEASRGHDELQLAHGTWTTAEPLPVRRL